jgi:FkbH-like protein
MDSKTYKTAIKTINQLVKSGNFNSAYTLTQETAADNLSFIQTNRIIKIGNSFFSDKLDFPKIRIALVSSSTIDFLSDHLKFQLGLAGFDAEIFIAEFNTVQQTLFNSESELYKFNPDIIWIFSTYRDALSFNQAYSKNSCAAGRVERAIDRYSELWRAIKKNSDAYIIQNNADTPLTRTFGNYECCLSWSDLNFIRSFNISLAGAMQDSMTIFDIDYISSFVGKNVWFDERLWYHSKFPFSLELLPSVSHKAAQLISSLKGAAKKCLVLDLDNTLWGGVIGDDGVSGIKLGMGNDGEAFVDFQRYILSLKNRGIILAVCSKNEETTAKLPFEQHPDMQLSLDDIAVFVANWNDKASNIEAIAKTLNIGLDSIVFLDDNPAEREIVRQRIPEVTVPQLPEDPAHYIRTLDKLSLFETTLFSKEDINRANQYKANAQLKSLEVISPANVNDFLKSLQMEAVASHFDNFTIPRISQLVNKSNQFHLTTTRYSQPEIYSMSKDKSYLCRCFKMKDKFSDNGLISFYILKRLDEESFFVDTFVMSCRVLSRGMEQFVFNDMLKTCKKYSCNKILGCYRPTKKNIIVKNLYPDLGFNLVSDSTGELIFELRVASAKPFDTFIREVTTY